jgi:hypothetical protein
MFKSIFALLLLLSAVFAILKITKSRETTGIKILWVVLILILPVIGLVAWFFIGPGDKSLKI